MLSDQKQTHLGIVLHLFLGVSCNTQLMTAASATARVHAGLATAALSPAEDPAEEPWSHCLTISWMQ